MRLLQLICRKDKDEDEDPKPKMDKAMGTMIRSQLNLEQLLNTVTRRHKVTQAAILDLKGDIVHVTSGWNTLLPDDGHKMGRVVAAAPVRGIWRVHIFGHDFYCFHCDQQKRTILARGGGTIMTVHVTQKYILVGLGAEMNSGSCLYEMKQVWQEMEARRL